MEVEYEVKFAHVLEIGIKRLDKVVDSLEMVQLVVVGIDAHAEKETGVAAVHNLVVAELRSATKRTQSQ